MNLTKTMKSDIRRELVEKRFPLAEYEKLKENPTWFWDAFSDARKACDLILGETHGREKETEEENQLTA